MPFDEHSFLLAEQVVDVFKNQMDTNLVYVDATDRFLNLLEGVRHPQPHRFHGRGQNLFGDSV